ncbi:MAG: hypothetical protein WD004_00840 [Actinomycetota bacterium]
MRRSRRFRSGGRGLVPMLAVAFVVLAALPALAGLTWDPAATARTANRPRTCYTTPNTCTDSGFTYTNGETTIAASNNGTTHYLHSLTFSDKPPGDSSNTYVSYTTDCSTKNDPLTGTPPYCSGVYYTRSSDSGATWTGGDVGVDAKRVGPGTLHITRGGIAASGQYVYVVYVTTVGYWSSMCAKDARVLYVVRNTDYGASGSWDTPIQLTSSSGRVDYPSIAASGTNVYVVNTDSDTGKIMFHRSTNNGSTFASQGIGFTQNTYDNNTSPGSPGCPSPPTPDGLEGFDGAPVVAGDGTTVGAAWVRSTGGKVVAKLSSDNGVTWPGGTHGSSCTDSPTSCTQNLTPSGALGPQDGTHAAQRRGAIDIAASSNRVVFAWKDTTGAIRPKGVYTKSYTVSGGWAAPRLVACLTTSSPCGSAPLPSTYNDAFSPAIGLWGTTGIGLAFSACPYTPTPPTNPCDDDSSGPDKDPGAEIIWKESWDNGATWWAGVSGSFTKIAGNSVTLSEVNEFPVVVMDKPGSTSLGCADGTQGPEVGCERFVMYTGRSRSFFDYTVYISRGTQT